MYTFHNNKETNMLARSYLKVGVLLLLVSAFAAFVRASATAALVDLPDSQIPASVLASSADYDKSTAHQKYWEDLPRLVYVTPWNNHGYDVAKWFRGKFDLVSPVWYSFRRMGVRDFVLHGAHDVDEQWMFDVRGDTPTKIVPRFIFESLTEKDVIAMMEDDNENEALANAIAKECRKEDNPTSPWQLDSELFSLLSSSVDFFSLMTYDFSGPHRVGPNSPVEWMEENVLSLSPDPELEDVETIPELRSKILLGFNFYGNDYTVGGQSRTILGRDLVQIFERSGESVQVEWDETYGEHVVRYVDGDQQQHVVYFPSLKSIDLRLRLAQELGVGISIWEIGQGLDYWYDLL